MPTPERIILAARKRRERICPICGVHFIASRPSAKGLCSRACQIENYKRKTTGIRKHSPETKAKMSKSGKAWRIEHPEWEAARYEAATAACRTPEYIQGALDRYRNMEQGGTGICSEATRAITADAAKWVMKKARAAMEAETDFLQLWKDTQDRLRREMPYDGPLETADHFEYLQKLGKALTSDPEIRAVQDGFMSAAIPRFYAEWKARNGQA